MGDRPRAGGRVWRVGGIALAALILTATLAGCLSAGREAPTFSLATATGDTVRLADYAGRVVVIDFMATTCAPCKEQVEDLRDLQSAHPTVAIISVSSDPTDTDAALQAWMREHNATWPHARDPGGNVTARYQVATIPTVTVVDAQGRIHYQSPPQKAVDRDRLFQAVAEATA